MAQKPPAKKPTPKKPVAAAKPAPRKSTRKKQKNTWIGTVAAGVALVGITLLFYWMFVPPAPKLPEPSVKALASKQGIQVGMLMYPYEVDTEPYTQIVTSQYSFVTIDGAMHWDQMRPSETEYDFKKTDSIVSFAERKNMGVQIHHLVWTEDDSLPKWLKKGTYSREKLYELMHDHITTVMQRYAGSVKEYTVVNEAFTRAKHMYGLDDWWGEHTGGGTEYIDRAFVWAHEADPNAQLILNDFANEVENDISNAQYEYLKSAKERGIPIDGIGMQLHIDAAHPPYREDMVRNMRRFGDLGYNVYITEFDVNSNKVKASKEEKAQLEARITNDVVRACVESEACTSFTVFGIKNKPAYKSWFTSKKPRSYLLDARYQPNPSYQAFHDAWQQY